MTICRLECYLLCGVLDAFQHMCDGLTSARRRVSRCMALYNSTCSGGRGHGAGGALERWSAESARVLGPGSTASWERRLQTQAPGRAMAADSACLFLYVEY